MVSSTHGALLFSVLVASLIAPASARAQGPCGLATRVPFAGHMFPLDSIPDLQPMTPVKAFPNLPPPASPLFRRPLFLTAPSDGSNRLFVVMQAGLIRVFPNHPLADSVTVFLDISDRVLSIFSGGINEQGLLGLAFDPDYASNGYFYVNYTAPRADCTEIADSCTKIVRFSVSAQDPDQADPNSAFQLLEYAQPAPPHNGGMLTFGPDDLLYIAAGDGGISANGQDTSTLLGALLRIDPHGGTPYAIPADNPFAGDPNRAQEIWAYGLRNPWRFSFDRLTGDVWIGDVGAASWEEVDFIAAGTPGGLNFGWDRCEGTHDVFGNDCSSIESVAPVLEYDHGPTGGFAITGGYIYRGDRSPGLYGAYIYGDFASGNIWAWDGVSAAPTQIATLTGVSSFGEDRDGELYLVRLTDGQIYRLEESGDAGDGQFPLTLSATGLFSDTANLVPAPGMIEYEVTTPLWSDGASKRRWVALPGTEQIEFDTTGAWSFPVGTAFVEHFELPISPSLTRRVEMRVFLRQVDRWIGYTYRWNDAQTDAELLTDALSEDFTVDFGEGPETQTYNYPAPAECLGCHTSAAGRVLGARTRQLNGPFDYPLATDNQLHAWNCIGLFTRDIGDPQRHGAYAELGDPNATLLERSRAYLATNCAICHQPLGPAPGGLDLRFAPLLGEMNLIGVAPSEGDLGLFNPERIKVGVKEESTLWHRIQATDPAIRMPRGSLVPDPLAVQALGDWIDTALATLDSDGDGVPDGSDNCPHGVGDACQCGDVDRDGDVDEGDPSDVQAIRLFLAGLPPGISFEGHRRCLAADSVGNCTIADVVRLRRALAGLPPPVEPVCDAATEPAP